MQYVVMKMNKELLMLYGARHAVGQMLEKGNCSFAKRLEDGTWQTIEYADICNYLTEKINSLKSCSDCISNNGNTCNICHDKDMYKEK